MQRPTVLYILGSGRCGSTLVDIVLGAHPRIMSLGELDKVPSPAWVGDGLCSCGQSGAECELWSEVKERFEDRSSIDDLLCGQRRFERFRSLPRLLMGRLIGTSGLRRHAAATAELANQVAAISGRNVLVDSSNNPVRGLIWSWARGVDARFLHLVRDGRGFVASRRRDPQPFWNRSVERTTLLWMASNVISSFLFSWRRGRYLRVRFEDFLEAPEQVLGEIGELLSLDMRPGIRQVVEREPIAASHMIGGNRLRMGDGVILDPTKASGSSLEPQDETRFWRLAAPIARYYGYRRDG